MYNKLKYDIIIFIPNSTIGASVVVVSGDITGWHGGHGWQ